MPTVSEFLRLAGGTLRLWRRAWPDLAAWWGIGWSIQLVAMLASVVLGTVSIELATVVFVLGALGLAAGTVLALHSTAAHLEHPRARFGISGRRDSLAASLVAVLTVYALWGLTDDSVRRLFELNFVLLGTGTDAWSVNLSRVSSYVVLAAVAWLLRRAVALTPPRRNGPDWAASLLEALWVFASFLAVAAAGVQVLAWWRTTVLAVGLGRAWNVFLGWLPEWSLWWDLTVPEVVAGATEFLVGTVLPAFWDAVLLPLVWLALAAVVLGWRDFTGQAVLTGARGERLAATAATGWQRLGPLRRPVAALLGDLTGKYLPVWHALRLVWRIGPAFLTAYLLWTALLQFAGQWAWVGVLHLFPDLDNPGILLLDLAGGFLHGLVFSTVLLAGCAAGVDRTLAAPAQ